MKKLPTLCCLLLVLSSAVKAQTFYATNNVNCNGDASGCILIDTSYVFPWGNPPYTYQLMPAGVFQNNSFCGLSGGVYTLTVIDSNNQTNNYSVTITEPPVFQISAISVTNIFCNGDNTGNISLQATGGTGFATFVLTPSIGAQIPSGNFTGLPAGTYTATGTDANGCSANTLVTITEPPALQITNITSTTPSCNPGCDGTMNITANGGTGFLAYNITPGSPIPQSIPMWNGLCGGTYLAGVIDANGCMDTATVNVLSPTAPNFTSAISTPATCGLSDGSINAIASGGTGAVAYTITPDPNAVGVIVPGNFTGLPSGAYSVSVVDINNCSAATAVMVQEQSTIQITNITITPPTCSPGNDGTVTITAIGGTGFLQYGSNSLGPIPQASNTFNGLSGGNYNFYVIDANGCRKDTSINIIPPTAQIFNTINSNPSNCGQATGIATVSVTGGTAPISYSIIAPVSYISTNTSGTFANLPADTYTIQVTDASNCAAITEVTIDEEAAVDFTNISSTNVSCNGSADGTVTVQTNGALGAYSLSILPAILPTSPNTFSNLASATYTLRLTDSSNCTRDTIITILEPSLLQLTNVQKTNVDCFGEMTGSVSATAIGGTGQYSFTLAPLNISNTSGIFQNLAAGSYELTLSEMNNCRVTTQITITEPPLLSFTASAQNAACEESSTGRIIIYPQGGSPGYSYSVNQNPSSTHPIISNLSPGTYNVEVTDSLGCQEAYNFTIGADSLELRIAARINESCEPGGDGILAVYGFPSDTNYLYSLDSIIWQTSGEFKNLNSSDYKTFLINPTTGCSASRTDSIRFKNDLPLDKATVTDERCFGKNNGRIVAKNKNYNYRLIPAVGYQSENGVISNVPPGLYTLIGEKANGCYGERIIEVLAADSLWISFESTRASNVHCYGSIDFAAMGGANNLSYSLTPKSGRELGPGSYDGLCWGDYTLTAKDGLGCTVSRKISIQEDPNAPRNMFHHFKVYPNPAQDQIWLQSDYLFEYEISLINLTGQCTQTKFVHDKLASIDVSALSPGIYILRFKSDVDRFERKILIQR